MVKNLFSAKRGPILSYKANLRFDLPASLVVFLLALPLCLGVALASGAPLYAGLIAGVVGGLVVTSLSGSALGVTGPSAGLAVIVFGAISELGFDAFLLAVVLAGIIQFIMGHLRAGGCWLLFSFGSYYRYVIGHRHYCFFLSRYRTP